MAKVKPVPEGFHTVTPYLVVDDGARAIEFYQQAFGAKEIMRMPGPDGKISHAEVKIGDSIIMLGPAQPTSWSPLSPIARQLHGQYLFVSRGR